jgi:CRP-like cAMP-binding protein
MTEKIWHLRRCNLFAQLTPEQISRLESRSLSRTYPRKSPIYLPGDHAKDVLLLAAGRAKICSLTDDGKQAIFGFIEPGELFGELAVVGPGERENYAEAVEKSTIIMIPSSVLLELMEELPGLSIGITKLIGLRRRRIERRLKNLLFRSNRQRITHLLLELVEQYGTRTADGVLIRIKLSHQDLADIIGSTRETVTVVLGNLQKEGYVVIGRRKIVVVDLERLAASVNEPAPRPDPRPGLTPRIT